MVSAQKMRRSQETALASRPYALRGLELLAELSRRAPVQPALMTERPVRRTLLFVVSADKGLAGSFNSAVLRRLDDVLRHGRLNGDECGTLVFSAVGKKADGFLRRRGLAPCKTFTGFGDYIEVEEIIPLADFLMEGFEKGEWDKVVAISTHFRTTLRQEVIVREMLPVHYASIDRTVREIVPEYGRYAEQNGFISEDHPYFEYLIEPSPEAVLASLARHLATMAVYQLIVEANASEHSARMVAMKNASDNADELKETLSLYYNKARQAAITKELAEITGGAEALASN